MAPDTGSGGICISDGRLSGVEPIDGVVQHYAWGDESFIPELFGLEPDGRPWAELWLGTHPAGPSVLADGRPLSAVSGELPYLLKVLAAAEPLSLQTHPDATQASDGFARGVYADDRPKPELLRALTPFEALCGVRPLGATLELLDELGLTRSELFHRLAEHGPATVIRTLYSAEAPVHDDVVAACRAHRHPTARWIARLADLHPSDPSVVVALLLNHLTLRPGEAVRLDAGTVHAYLRGAGVELMGASDNVVRAGLTSKHVDVDELLRIADLDEVDDPTLPAAARHDLPAAGVSLVALQAGQEHSSTGHELVLGLDGTSGYLAPGARHVATAASFVVTPVRR